MRNLLSKSKKGFNFTNILQANMDSYCFNRSESQLSNGSSMISCPLHNDTSASSIPIYINPSDTFICNATIEADNDIAGLVVCDIFLLLDR